MLGLLMSQVCLALLSYLLFYFSSHEHHQFEAPHLPTSYRIWDSSSRQNKILRNNKRLDSEICISILCYSPFYIVFFTNLLFWSGRICLQSRCLQNPLCKRPASKQLSGAQTSKTVSIVTTQHCCYSTERVLDKCMNNDGYAPVNFHLQKQAMDWIWPMDQLQSIAITSYLGGSVPLYFLIPFCLSFLSKFCKKKQQKKQFYQDRFHIPYSSSI